MGNENTQDLRSNMDLIVCMLGLDNADVMVGTRKSSGAPFATRISELDRKKLDWWAATGGVSVSVVARLILRYGLRKLDEESARLEEGDGS